MALPLFVCIECTSLKLQFKSYSFLKLSKVNSRVVPHPIARGLDHALYYMTFVATEDMVGFLRISNLLCYPSWLMEKKSNFVGLKHQICLTEVLSFLLCILTAISFLHLFGFECRLLLLNNSWSLTYFLSYDFIGHLCVVVLLFDIFLLHLS